MRKVRLICYIEKEDKEKVRSLANNIKSSMSAITRSLIKENLFTKKFLQKILEMNEIKQFLFLNEILGKNGETELKKILKEKNKLLAEEVLKIIKD